MRNTDQYIDQVLHSLGNTEAPSGLEQRVSARIEQLSHAKVNRTSSASSFIDLLKLPRIPAAAYPVAIAALIVLGITALISHRKPSTFAVLNKPALTNGAPPLIPSEVTVQSQPRVKASPPTRLVHEAAPATPLPAPTDPDAIALAETLAPSHPAPPRQLNQQERLMLTILRSGEQEEIAALIPAERDARFAQDQAAFNDYFALTSASSHSPSTTGDQK